MEQRVQTNSQIKEQQSHQSQSLRHTNSQQSLFAKSYATNSTYNPEQTIQDLYRVLQTELPNSHTQITLKMVKKLLSWLIEEASKQHFRRQVYSLACQYLKIYLQKAIRVKRKQFQLIGISCFLLASKMDRWGKLPQIDFEKFSKIQIERLQMDISIQLGFNYVLTSYIKLANEIAYNWDNFMKDMHYYEIQYFSLSYTSYQNIRYFFEKLDCIYLTYKSHQYDKRKLVINTFFLESYKNCMQSSPKYIVEECIDIYTKKQTDFWKIFQKFLIYIGIQKQQLNSILDIEMGKFLSKFFQLKIQTNSQQAHLPKVHSLVDFFNFQTFNQQAQKLANLIQSNQI